MTEMTEKIEEKKVNTKVFIFGPWVRTKEDGSVEVDKGGQKVAEYLRGNITEVDDKLAELLKIELAAEKQFRELLAYELNRIRAFYLDYSNSIIADLTNPGRTVVEAYNNGMKMGEHHAGVKLSHKLSDLLDKIKLEEILKYEKE